MSFKAPTKDYKFNLFHMGTLEQIRQSPRFSEFTDDIVEAVLEGNARLVEDVIAPLNREGDINPAQWDNGKVTATPGFQKAYDAFCEGGWQSLSHNPDFGGQGFPETITTATFENINSANLAFSLCPLLTNGVIEALSLVGSDEIKKAYLPNLIEGKWSGTMNLTEPQAGSDLALLKTKAVKQDDGSYRIKGQKIFITWGEHDLTENIIHLVLARTPDAPPGVKGISLFIVPKFMVNEDGSLGDRNDVYCGSIEHKMGIHGSPTAELLFGDDKGDVGPGAIGYLVGQENEGLAAMFIMMNGARYGVGLQGVSISERAMQQAYQYAADRLQGNSIDGSTGHDTVAINKHPDVQRMLLTMKSMVQGSRTLAYYCSSFHDLYKITEDKEEAEQYRAIQEYLVPIVKGFSTEMCNELTSLAVQIHGGMGFIEETGVAQHYRDARILAIYEGTTGIQSNDFLGRKTMRDSGAVAQWFLGEVEKTLAELHEQDDEDFEFIAKRLQRAVEDYKESVVHLLMGAHAKKINEQFYGSVSYLMLAGYAHVGWHLARSALVVKKKDLSEYKEKIELAKFYAAQILPRTHALSQAIQAGDQTAEVARNVDFSPENQ